MADKPDTKPTGSSSEAPDLTSLISGLDFGPSWADGSSKPKLPKSFEREGKPGRGGPRDGHRGDRRPPRGDRRPPQGGSAHRGPDRKDGEHRGPDRRGPVPHEFKPTVQVDLYPQDEAFDALVNRLRATARTYQLFEIAHLILEKPERFVVVVANKATGGAKPEPLFYSVPGHLPFETGEAALNHVMKHHLDLFFDVEEVEIDPPKGNFQMVNRCTVTGELLGPPNYHRYQEFVQRHYAARITGMAMDRFLSKIETVKDQEVIDAWVESMKKGARYRLKDRAEGEPEALESLEAVRHFLVQHRKDKVVGSGESVRFAGRDIDRLPRGDIRRSVETYVEQQRHFPLDTANNLRGRLRRHKFTVYKKGSKGVSFVCAVKRNFRDAKTVFTDSIQQLIEFIESNPDIPASKVPKAYLGIDTEKNRPEELKVTDKEIEAAKEAAPEEDAATAEAVPQPAPDAAASTGAKPKGELSGTETKQLNQLMLDLRWLIMEGYVTEYGDGRLFAPPPLPEPKKEFKEKEPAKATAETAPPVPADEQPKVAAEEAVQPDAPEPESAPAEASVPEPETEAEPEPRKGPGRTPDKDGDSA